MRFKSFFQDQFRVFLNDWASPHDPKPMLQEGRTAEDCLTDSTARKGIAKLSHILQAPRSVKLL